MKDDGRTWGGGLVLDERKSVSYPDGQQQADGLIRLIYDYDRTGERTYSDGNVSRSRYPSGETREQGWKTEATR